jgi:glycosyltransferase involved in cell wall biosynthesis
VTTARRRLVILTEIIAPYRIPVFNSLAKREGIDLHVIFLSETDPELRQWRVYKDEIQFSYEVLRSRRVRLGKRVWLWSRGLRSALDRRSPDVVICGGYSYIASWNALRWARRRGAAIILWSESNQQDQRRQRIFVAWLKRYFVRKCDGFVVPGKSSFEYLQLLGAPEEKIVTAPNAVDSGYFEAQAEGARRQDAEVRKELALPRRYVLFVGRLVPEKGVFDLLEAYAKLDNTLRSDVGLVFAGDGECRAEITERAKTIQPGTVCCPGFAQREDLGKLYGLAEAFVLPTHSDPWGLVVNEAMACGLPVIVTEVAGCTGDLVDDGWNGYVVKAGAIDRLRAAMTTLLQEPGLRREMGSRSYERIRLYSPYKCAEGLAAAVDLPATEKG